MQSPKPPNIWSSKHFGFAGIHAPLVNYFGRYFKPIPWMICANIKEPFGNVWSECFGTSEIQLEFPWGGNYRSIKDGDALGAALRDRLSSFVNLAGEVITLREDAA